MHERTKLSLRTRRFLQWGKPDADGSGWCFHVYDILGKQNTETENSSDTKRRSWWEKVTTQQKMEVFCLYRSEGIRVYVRLPKFIDWLLKNNYAYRVNSTRMNLTLKNRCSLAWWHMPVILALRGWGTMIAMDLSQPGLHREHWCRNKNKEKIINSCTP